MTTANKNATGKPEGIITSPPATCSAALGALLKKYPSNGRRMREKREHLASQMADWRARGLVQYGGNSWADVLMPPNDAPSHGANNP